MCVLPQVFGLPSVRTNVPLPATRSVANTHNYGNEPTAYQLLTPPKCVDMGVKEEHLLQPRGRQEMQELLAAAGIGMSEPEFEAVFGLAVALSGRGGRVQLGGADAGAPAVPEKLCWLGLMEGCLKSCAGLD